jgi:hypothetical protein
MSNEQALMPIDAPAETAPTTMLAVIARAANDPTVDIDKLERLLAMKERMDAKDAEAAFNRGMTDAQTRMRPVSADANNPQTRSAYATYTKLDKALRAIYTGCGFSLSFDTEDSAKADHIRVLCYVSHNGGHTRTYKADMPVDGKGAKGNDVMTKTHAFGSGTSYGMRYLLKMIFNVTIGEDDDDGNSAAGYSDIEYISEQQETALRDMMTEYVKNKAAFQAYISKTVGYTVNKLCEIPANKYDAIIKYLKEVRDDAVA